MTEFWARGKSPPDAEAAPDYASLTSRATLDDPGVHIVLIPLANHYVFQSNEGEILADIHEFIGTLQAQEVENERGHPMKTRTTVKRESERELVVTRTFNGPALIAFEAWTKPELLKRWRAPKSTGVFLLSREADVRAGGKYRFEFGHEASKPMAFFTPK